MDTTQSKKCEQCSNTFIPNNRTGYEQKYCSKTCRYKAGNNRRLENFTNKYIGANEKVENNIQAEPIRQNSNFSNFNDNQIELIKEIERLKYENELSKIERYYESKLVEINSTMKLIERKLNDNDFDEEEIENKNEMNPIISGILNTEFGKQLAQHPSIGKIVEHFIPKQ